MEVEPVLARAEMEWKIQTNFLRGGLRNQSSTIPAGDVPLPLDILPISWVQDVPPSTR